LLHSAARGWWLLVRVQDQLERLCIPFDKKIGRDTASACRGYEGKTTLRRIDLNELYSLKCNGGAWEGAIFCQLGEGGSAARLLNSLRFTKDSFLLRKLFQELDLFIEELKATKPEGWKQAGEKVAILGGLKALDVTVLKKVRATLERGEQVTVEELDTIAKLIEGLFELPGIKKLMDEKVFRKVGIKILL